MHADIGFLCRICDGPIHTTRRICEIGLHDWGVREFKKRKRQSDSVTLYFAVFFYERKTAHVYLVSTIS